jgi:hypothetical protein
MLDTEALAAVMTVASIASALPDVVLRHHTRGTLATIGAETTACAHWTKQLINEKLLY